MEQNKPQSRRRAQIQGKTVVSSPTFHDISGDEYFDAPRLLRKPETPIHAVLFDLDGTIIDSEPLYKRANKFFLQRHGIEIPDSTFDRFIGVGARNFINT